MKLCKNSVKTYLSGQQISFLQLWLPYFSKRSILFTNCFEKSIYCWQPHKPAYLLKMDVQEIVYDTNNKLHIQFPAIYNKHKTVNEAT